VSATTYSLACEELVQHFESLHDGDLKVIGLQPKLCPAGYWTLGWGHVAIDPATNNPLMGEAGRERALALYLSMSVLEAKALLKMDLNRRLSTVLKLITVPLTQGQLDALVSFQFNTGSLPTSTLLKYVNAGKHTEAAQQFLRWNKARVKGELVVLAGLTRRRNAERAQYMGSDWTFFKNTQPR
jgi:lysozyme